MAVWSHYRDGVGNKQYQDIQNTEIPQIQQAWNDFQKTGALLRLTVVIVTKRHNTRFYPISSEDTMPYNENCRPGTLVDGIVTSPYFDDFFLQSHNGLKGTARSAHYFIFQNGMQLSSAELQNLVSILAQAHM
jgi:eukaryotic translation initiation factor 2C